MCTVPIASNTHTHTLPLVLSRIWYVCNYTTTTTTLSLSLSPPSSPPFSFGSPFTFTCLILTYKRWSYSNSSKKESICTKTSNFTWKAQRTYSKSSNTERGLIQNPAREREMKEYRHIGSHIESSLLGSVTRRRPLRRGDVCMYVCMYV